jgi:peptide deformylase
MSELILSINPLDGRTKVQGQVSRYLTQIIQHEIDHLNVTAFAYLIPKEKQISIEEYRKMREKIKESKMIK